MQGETLTKSVPSNKCGVSYTGDDVAGSGGRMDGVERNRDEEGGLARKSTLRVGRELVAGLLDGTLGLLT